MTDKSFHLRLRAALQRSRFRTQRALAAATDIDPTYLSRLWRGQVDRPTYETVYKLATALGCLVTDLAPWFEVEDVPATSRALTAIATAVRAGQHAWHDERLTDSDRNTILRGLIARVIVTGYAVTIEPAPGLALLLANRP